MRLVSMCQPCADASQCEQTCIGIITPRECEVCELPAVVVVKFVLPDAGTRQAIAKLAIDSVREDPAIGRAIAASSPLRTVPK